MNVSQVQEQETTDDDDISIYQEKIFDYDHLTSKKIKKNIKNNVHQTQEITNDDASQKIVTNDQMQTNKSRNYHQGVKHHYDVNNDQEDDLLPEISSTMKSIEKYASNNKEITKIMFMRSRNPGSDAIAAVMKILLPKQGKNNENIKFLKGRSLEYMAQHRSRFNNDLCFYADEYIKINNINVMPNEDAFMLHVIHCLTNSDMDNHHTLQQVKELDHITNNLIIPNVTQKNASNQINNVSEVIHRHHTRRLRK
ncbi:3443_t:CDS:2 [Funneliformis geosporum]|uniref:2871_t:CDS:1 n=1 Tax=Funneliformis geosporum TaxID=1117311 RepID=A0A9W4SZT9_9GLOM|nr:2871_t:CDS:2 [Funneliformis geosporum]CAI2187794.1 3443_t:CDS:2 [Funneliformis geosporum]